MRDSGRAGTGHFRPGYSDSTSLPKSETPAPKRTPKEFRDVSGGDPPEFRPDPWLQ